MYFFVYVVFLLDVIVCFCFLLSLTFVSGLLAGIQHVHPGALQREDIFAVATTHGQKDI